MSKYTSEIITAGMADGTLWGVRFIVCANDEVIADRTIGEVDETGNGWSSEADDAAAAAIAVIQNAGYDYDLESDFRKYNGGPFSQTVEIIWYMADGGDDDDADELIADEWESIWRTGAGATKIPSAIVEKIEAIQNDATEAMRATMARLAAERRATA